MIEVGSSGSLGVEWNVQNARRNALSRLYGQQLNYSAAISAMGTDMKDELRDLEIELKYAESDNPLDFDDNLELLNQSRALYNTKNLDDGLYQSNNGEFYTNLDLEKGSYDVLSERQFAASQGITYTNENDKPYDFIEFGYNTAKFTDLVFAGAGDGRTNQIDVDINKLTDVRWGYASFKLQDVDADNVASIKSAVPAYMLEKIEDAVASYQKGTPEYNAKFLEVAAALMDQEGYTQGKQVDPDKGTLQQSTSPFNVSRDSNGQVKITINSDKNVNIKGVGTMNGSGVFSLGVTTDGSNESVIQAGNKNDKSSLNLAVNHHVGNLDAYGQKVNAYFYDQIGSLYNVNWRVNNGRIDSTQGQNVMFLDVNGENNTFDLGGSTYIIDESNENNVFNRRGNTVTNR